MSQINILINSVHWTAIYSNFFLISRYQQLSSTKLFFFPVFMWCIYIYTQTHTHFVKYWKAWMQKKSQSFIKKSQTLETLENSSRMQAQLGKRLYEEIRKATGKMLSGNPIFHFDMLKIPKVPNQEIPDPQQGPSRNTWAESKLFNLFQIIVVCKTRFWQMFNCWYTFAPSQPQNPLPQLNKRFHWGPYYS